MELTNIYTEETIDMGKFDFSHYYDGEQRIIKPQLEKLGYTNIKFYDGERDSFGPLSRVIHATKDGERVELWYGW